MFSPRVLALLAIGAAAVAALPAGDPFPRPIVAVPTDDDLDDSWFGFPFFSDFFSPIFKLFPSFDFVPKIVANDDLFQVSIQVKEYKKEELKVKVKNGAVSIQGTHESKKEDHDVFASQFFHSYSLPANVSVAEMKAELSTDGWLTVTAPVKAAGGEREAERVVEIQETGAPYEPPKDSGPTASTSADDDRKEPTTPPTDREEVTDRDNSIPHGTEAAIV